MAHDPRLIKHEDTIEDLKPAIPDWIKSLKRPATPCVVPAFGPLEGIRVVGTGQLIAQPYIGTKLAEFGAEVIHIERAGGDVFRFTAPQLTRGPRPHGCDEAEVTKNKLPMGVDLAANSTGGCVSIARHARRSVSRPS
jgi:CoA-transferase family III